MQTFVVVGHVDHGKSTLLGRLMQITGQIKEDRVRQVERICEARGIAVEPAFFLDALEEEQAQGITIDTTSARFTYGGRQFNLIDAPGHADFLKNMASGASLAERAILVIDCMQGIRAQTVQHVKLLSILGLREVIVVINKIDCAEYSPELFERSAEAARALLDDLGLKVSAVIPVSALHGHNLDALLNEMLVDSDRVSLVDAPLRMILQDVYKFDQERYIAARVLSGTISADNELMFLPSGKIGKVASLFENVSTARAGDSVAFTLTEPLFVERGEVIAGNENDVQVDTIFSARLCWVSLQPFDPTAEYTVKLGTAQVACTIAPETGLTNGTVAEASVTTRKPIAFDNQCLSKFVICTSTDTVAFGTILAKREQTQRSILVNPNVVAESGFVAREQKEARQGHGARVVWLTGLSGSGKSTIARILERKLFDQGKNAVVLDADNVRTGLNADLGFSRADRAENIRRLAHVAKLFADNGAVVIVCAISPFEADRSTARTIIGDADFIEVFVFCPIEICRQRDPKGLYARATTGELVNFTGIDMAYQPPHSPALRLDTSTQSPDECAGQVLHICTGE